MTDLLYLALMLGFIYFGSAAFCNAVFFREKWAGYALTSIISFSLIFVFHLILDTP